MRSSHECITFSSDLSDPPRLRMFHEICIETQDEHAHLGFLCKFTVEYV